MTILPNYSFTPRVSEGGDVVNSYIVSIKNRGRHDEELKVTAEGMNGRIQLKPHRTFRVKAGSVVRYPVYISVKDVDRRDSARMIHISVETMGEERIRTTEEANFILPDGR